MGFVDSGDALGTRGGNRRHREVYPSRSEALQKALAGYHALERGIIPQERDDDALRGHRIGRGSGELGAHGGERLGFARRPIEDPKRVAGLEKIGGDRLTEVAQPDESDFLIHGA